jgi:trehalose/maltose hydrolase-like predicted phosphorylase
MKQQTWRKSDSGWILRQKGFGPSEERERETLFSIGNGYCGLRGSCNLLIPSSQADLYIAGVYDAKAEHFPYSETEFLAAGDRDEPFPELVSFPFPFQVKIRVGDRELSIVSEDLAGYERELDLKRSVLSERYEFIDAEGHQTVVRTFRCASLADPHLLLHEIEVTALNHSGQVEIDTSLEDPDVKLRHPHLKLARAPNVKDLSDIHVFETRKSKIRACLAARTSLDGREHGRLVSTRATPGEPIRVRRFVTIYTSREEKNPVSAAHKHARALKWNRFSEYLGAQDLVWDKFWRMSDIEIEDNPPITQMLRFNSYHLRIAAPVDEYASIGARTLSGRAYEGHIFWDAEVFILPSLLFTHPELARNMLSYRYHTLPGAKERARRLGYEGACFAWESTASGLDATPKVIRLEGTDAKVPIFTGTQQIHITGSVSHGVLQYWKATGDDRWLASYGAEILFETSRFWLSRAKERRGAYHIDDVVGPDEYHHGVDDNTYTNWLARHNLVGALEVAEWLQRWDPKTWDALSHRLKLKARELESWRHMARHIFIPEPDSSGVFPQFEGFFDLKDVPLKSEEKYRAPFERLLKWNEVNSAKILKQADFLMTPFLFPDAFTPEQVRANFLYYERITDHGSSLSPAVHSAIAARIGEHEFVRRYWEAGLKLDLQNLMKNTALGFHAACAAGTWQALVFHILGISPYSEREWVFPKTDRLLPIKGEAIRLKLMRRGKIFSRTFESRAPGRKAA